MLDLRWIRENPRDLDHGLQRRGLKPMSERIRALDGGRRNLQTGIQGLQTRRNEASREIGAAKKEGRDSASLRNEVADIKNQIPVLENQLAEIDAEIEALLADLPNLPAGDVPDGPDESANVELRRVGAPPEFGFAERDHVAIGEALGMMDFAAASRLSGARFVVLNAALARLERALAAFMLDLHTTEFGYTETSTPFLVRDAALFGTGQLPKFAEDLFKTDTDHWLIPTAEVPLTNLVAGEILDAADLPLRYVALTPCFRSEAGAAGRDTRGMLRQHQFHKVELVSVTRPEDSPAEHERMTAAAEEVLKRLQIPYRVVVLSTGDMGFAAEKTYDIEVWLPGQSAYREISSCSNCGAFQARRMRARYRPEDRRGTALVHTLNGSGVAVGRLLIAVLENGQQADGSVALPAALGPYMGGLDAIRPARRG
ncbi:MAG: serine--tRNA ligase [Defluviicoccus sp.]|nr:serine--tRNA ligase [Defluviicoccus sp.]MDE0383501.1 serine--tRNA ligase [Defluviicoccus sp.]